MPDLISNYGLEHFEVSTTTDPSVLAATYIGNGAILSKVGAVLIDSSGTQWNAGDLATFSYELRVWDNTTDFSTDPFGHVVHQFDFSAHSEYTNIGNNNHGHELWYIEFDVTFLNIATTAGNTELLALVPFNGETSHQSYIQFSTGSNSIGLEPDWYCVLGFHSPSPVIDHTWAPTQYGAMYIETVDAPIPANYNAFATLVQGWGTEYFPQDLIDLSDAWLTNQWP